MYHRALSFNTISRTVKIIRFIRKILGFPQLAQKQTSDYPDANVISRSDHIISRKDISSNAIKVLYRLHNAGYQAFLVGGGVRDLLVGMHPKDFDIVTGAKPNQIKRLFKNCRLIGRRFRLAHIYFQGEIIEVATFRAAHRNESPQETPHGIILNDNVYGRLDEDVWRRDFTVNAIYYNIADFSLVDFTNGYEDLKHRLIRMIGDPEVRYREDPVRMIRAARLSAKLDFEIEEKTAKSIQAFAKLLEHIAPARLFEEFNKLFRKGHAQKSFVNLRKYHLFRYICYQLDEQLNSSHHETCQRFIDLVLMNTDKRINEDKPVTLAFLFAAFLWYPLITKQEELMHAGEYRVPAFHSALKWVIKQQQQQTTIPKRLLTRVRDIWFLQNSLIKIKPKTVWRTFTHPSFRAAYDFLILRSESGENLKNVVTWWTDFQEVSANQRQRMVDALNKSKKRKNNRTEQ